MTNNSYFISCDTSYLGDCYGVMFLHIKAYVKAYVKTFIERERELGFSGVEGEKEESCITFVMFKRSEKTNNTSSFCQ